MHIHDYFDDVARSDDPLLFTEAGHQQMAGLRKRLGDLTGLRILEPGCGAGPLTEYLADWVGPEGHVCAFDSSEEMARLCRQRVLEAGGRGNVEVCRATVEEMELTRGAWDRIILFRLFPHLEEKEGVLERLRMALAPGGRLIIANLEGSAGLNRFHAGLDAPVRHDHMPCLKGTTVMLEKQGYKVRVGVDTKDEFFVEAVSLPGNRSDTAHTHD